MGGCSTVRAAGGGVCPAGPFVLPHLPPLLLGAPCRRSLFHQTSATPPVRGGVTLKVPIRIRTLAVPVSTPPGAFLAGFFFLKSRNNSPLQPNVKCQTCEGTRDWAPPPGWHAPLHVRRVPTPSGLRKLKKFPVLFSFSASVLFHLRIYLSALRSPLPLPALLHLLLHTYNMSSFIFCTYGPFFPIELPALATPLALLFPLRGLIISRH